MTSQKYEEEEGFVKKLFFTILDAFVPADTTTVKQKVLENMFTIVDLKGDTVTLKLADELGGKVFDLNAVWKENYGEYGPSMEQVWQSFPEDVKKIFSDYVSRTLPNAQLVNNIPGIEYVRGVIDAAKPANPYVVDHSGKTIHIAGKLFTVQGFLFSLLVNMFFKLAYRAVFRRGTLTARNIAGDALTGTAACSAVFLTKVIVTAAVAAPPVSLMIGLCAVTGWAASFVVRSTWGEDEVSKK